MSLLWALIIRYSHAWSCIACQAPKYHKESKRLDSNIHFPFFCQLFDEGRFNDYQHTWPFNLKTSLQAITCTSTANATIQTKGFNYNPLPLPAKFRFGEISPMRIFSLAKFCGCEFSLWRSKISRVRIFSPTKIRRNEISLQWMRNFAKIRAKFRLTQWKFASALTKFRGEISSNFRENKERKTPNFVCISFAQYCK